MEDDFQSIIRILSKVAATPGFPRVCIRKGMSEAIEHAEYRSLDDKMQYLATLVSSL
jgi:hypothetical protein